MHAPGREGGGQCALPITYRVGVAFSLREASSWGGGGGGSLVCFFALVSCVYMPRPCDASFAFPMFAPLTGLLRSLLSQGVIWFRLNKGPLHFVANQYFKLRQMDDPDAH